MAKKKASKAVSQVKTKQYDSEDSRKRLRTAALEIFSRDGYDAATTRKIAEAAGVNEALIQRYFQGKQGLLFALMDEFHEKHALNRLEAPAVSIETELKSFFKNRLQFGRESQLYYKLIISRAILDPEVRVVMRKYSTTYFPELKVRLKTLQDAGKIKTDVDLEDLTRFIESMVMGWIVFLEVMEIGEKIRIDRMQATAIKVLTAALQV